MVWQRKFEKLRLVLRGVALLSNMIQVYPDAVAWLMREGAASFGAWLEELMKNDEREAAEDEKKTPIRKAC